MSLSVTYTFSPGATIFASRFNQNFSDVETAFNTHETATTGVHGVGAGAVVGTTLSQVLSGKTLTAPVINSGTLTNPTLGLIDKGSSGTGTVTCDCSTGSKFLIKATGNFTLAFSNFANGQRVEVWILQDATGSRLATWPTVTRWTNGTGATDSTTDAPTLTTTPNKFDIISFEKFDAVGTDGLLYANVRAYKGAIT